MEDNQQRTPDTAPADFIVDNFRPEDAEGIVQLFREVYGEHYPIKLFYDPAALTEANRVGNYYSIVARTGAGEILGVNHLFRSAPYRGLYESGVGLVSRAARNLGANKRMMEYIYETFVPQNPHIEEVFGEPVCNHPYMQKTVNNFRYIEMAMEVALMPAEAYSKEQSASGRVATLAAFRCYRPRPHRVFLPEPYEKILRQLYARLDDERDLEPSTGSIPKYALSEATMTIFDYAGVARIAVEEVGEEFGSYISDLEDEARARNVVVFQVWLKAMTPWIGQAVDILRDAGYFFGGALPRWFDLDGLLMQKILCPPDFDQIVLDSAFSKELLEVVQEDWKRANP